jgi:hypothetical protein
MAQERQQRRLGVSLSQVIAGTLASVSAAVVASSFGIAGTLIGAATSGGARGGARGHRSTARPDRRTNAPGGGDGAPHRHRGAGATPERDQHGGAVADQHSGTDADPHAADCRADRGPAHGGADAACF